MPTRVNGSSCDLDAGEELGRFTSIAVGWDDRTSSGARAVEVCSSGCPRASEAQARLSHVMVACYGEEGLYVSNRTTHADQLIDIGTRLSDPESGECLWGPFAVADSKPLFGYCLPTANATEAFKSTGSSITSSKSWTQAVNSIRNGIWIVVACGVIALVLGFVYLLVLRCCARPLTLIGIVGFFAGIVAGGVFLLSHAKTIQDQYQGADDAYQQDPNWKWAFYGAIALFVLAGLYACLLAFLCSRIMLAIELVEEAATQLASTPGIVFVPVVMILIGIAVVAIWSATALQLYSIGEVVTTSVPSLSSYIPNGQVHTINTDESAQRALVFHVFGFFWETQLLVALTEMTVAFVAVMYYFAPIGSSGYKELPAASPTLAAIGTVLWYHLGTAAFGAGVIALIKFIRACIEYTRHKLQQADKSGVAQWVLCCCQSFFWCLECCMKFINRNAYIMVALTKQPFCQSAHAALVAIVSNGARVGALALVSTPFLWLGKVFVAAISALIAYAIFTGADRYSNPESETVVSAPMLPVLLVFFLAYAIGSMFMAVYGVTIDTILMCYVFEESGKGEPRMSEERRVMLKRLNDECKEAVGDAPASGGSSTESAGSSRPLTQA